MKTNRLSGIYAITDEKWTPDEEVVEKVKTALQHGASIIQYRNKSMTAEAQEDICRQLLDACRQAGGLFFINDHIDLALKIGADGVHTGINEGEIEQISQKINGQILWGVSCYGDLARAEEAVNAGADYVAFGAFFPSPTKPKAAVVPKEVIQEAKSKLKVPVAVIGGINQENISQLTPYSPDMYACVTAVFQGDIAENLNALNGQMKA